MRAVDAAALARVDEATLVERAGTAVATWALRLMGGSYGRRVVVIAGKGNNGADGRVAAARLRRRGRPCEVVEALDGPERIGPRGTVDLVVDAAFGTGFRGEYRAPAVPAGVPVLAVDIPSGVDGDTGEACGEPLRADCTVTFAALKPGLLFGDGPLLAGRVVVADIGLRRQRGHHRVGGRRRRGPLAPAAADAPPTNGRRRWRWWQGARAWPAPPSCAPGAPTGPVPGWCAWGSPACRPPSCHRRKRWARLCPHGDGPPTRWPWRSVVGPWWSGPVWAGRRRPPTRFAGWSPHRPSP